MELALVKLCQLGVPQTIQNAPAAPVAQTAPKASSAPAAAASQPQVSQPAQTAPAAPAAPAGKPAAVTMPKMPKIGLGLGPKPAPKEEAPAEPEQLPQEEQNRPFTADQLNDAWVGLASTHKEELRLKQLIENYTPVLVEENMAEIQMPNPWQLDQMRSAMPTLLGQLRRALHNSHIMIRLVLAEYDREQMAYTAEEKYALMAEANPALAELKEKLDLQID